MPLLLVLICVLAWLPGIFSMPPLDRDESRFAEASREMLASGNWVDIRFHGEARNKKPIGIYWLQAASSAVLGEAPRTAIWTYRVPSLLGALAAVFLLFWALRPVVGTDTAFYAGAFLGTSVLLMAEAHIAKTDAVLLASIMGAQSVLLHAYLGARKGRPAPRLAVTLAGWGAFAIGVLVKGPVILFVCAGTALGISLWDRQGYWLARLRPLSGIALALIIILPWAVAIGIATHGQFYTDALGGDFASKLAGGQESHGQPPGYYLALASLTFWPGTLLLLPGIFYGVRKRAEPLPRFLLVWAGLVWIVFELTPTKLPHYILPAYPALAALAALWLTNARAAREQWPRIIQLVSIVLFALAGLALAVFIAIAPALYGAGSPWWLYGLAALGAAGIAASTAWALRERWRTAVVAALASALVLYGTLGWAVAPRLDDLWLSPRMAEAILQNSKPGDPQPLVVGYGEPSLVFLLQGRVRFETGSESGLAAARDGGLAFIESREEKGFLEAVESSNANAEPIDRISGLNYSRGQKTQMVLYRITPRANGG
jgi:4-amino-4-deoxy-L-arabinose transferase-like glycosyltransferase